MKKIIIIGGGFAGLSAIFSLLPYKKWIDLEITLIDEMERASFLPMLPDCLGRNVKPEHLSLDLAGLSARKHFNFIKDKAIALDLEKREVITASLALNYDFLVIASGSETNFYANNEIKEKAFKLDNAQDASSIYQDLGQKSYASYLIAGGGYTGIEIATNLSVYLKRKKINKRIIIIERAPEILGPLPRWMKDCVADNLKKLNIEVLANSIINKIEGLSIRLASGKTFDNSLLIWAAGVRTSDFIQNLKIEKSPQGRIKVDAYLRVNNSCFAAGDSAYFRHKNNYLRMAVQFAITEGKCCAKNIARSITGKQLIKYKPLDLGLIVPMANNQACGIILGINIRGFLPVLLHYFMCIYRSYGLKNKFGIIRDLLGKIDA